jgi:hypothetical protein
VDSSRHLTTDSECRSGNNNRKETEDGKKKVEDRRECIRKERDVDENRGNGRKKWT